MLLYIVKRILLFIPTLVVLSLLAFGLQLCTPGDPVARLLPPPEATPSMASLRYSQRSYADKAALLGVDRPVFYFTVRPAAYPDTLHRIMPLTRQKTLTRLLDRYGNWPQIQAYYEALQQAERAVLALNTQQRSDGINTVRNGLRGLYLQADPAVVINRVEQYRTTARQDSLLQATVLPTLETLQQRFIAVQDHPQRHLLYIPRFHWYGAHNRYRHWFGNFLRGDFGVSLEDRRPVPDKIWEAVRWTLIINGMAIIMAYLLSVPLGVYLAQYYGTRFDKWVSLFLFALYSLPSFWIATLLQTFFTTPEYGMDWFHGLVSSDVPIDASWWQAIQWQGSRLFLPVFCLTYGSLAYITRQVRGSMHQVLQSDYIQAARARGLSAQRILWRHAFRNALFPLITLFASIFPVLLAGSVIIEVIFNIPGMGRLMVDAINTDDWPVVYTILLLAGVLTILGILLSDILYKIADPRVDFQGQNTT